MPAKQALIEIIKKFENTLSIEDYYVPLFGYLENRSQFLIDICARKPIPYHRDHNITPNRYSINVTI